MLPFDFCHCPLHFLALKWLHTKMAAHPVILIFSQSYFSTSFIIFFFFFFQFKSFTYFFHSLQSIIQKLIQSFFNLLGLAGDRFLLIFQLTSQSQCECKSHDILHWKLFMVDFLVRHLHVSEIFHRIPAFYNELSDLQ